MDPQQTALARLTQVFWPSLNSHPENRTGEKNKTREKMCNLKVHVATLKFSSVARIDNNSILTLKPFFILELHRPSPTPLYFSVLLNCANNRHIYFLLIAFTQKQILTIKEKKTFSSLTLKSHPCGVLNKNFGCQPYTDTVIIYQFTHRKLRIIAKLPKQ